MKVIIVEDEFLAQQELSRLINTHSQMEIVGSFDDGRRAEISPAQQGRRHFSRYQYSVARRGSAGAKHQPVCP